MPIFVHESVIFADTTPHWAWLVGDVEGLWACTWLPGVPLDRTTAESAVILADLVALAGPRLEAVDLELVATFAGERGLSLNAALLEMAHVPDPPPRKLGRRLRGWKRRGGTR